MNESYTKLLPDEVDYVLVATNNGGPWFEDLYFLIFTKDRYWKVPNANAKPVFEWLKSFPAVDWAQSVRASGWIKAGVFILWRRVGVPIYSIVVRKELFDRLVSFIQQHFSVTIEKADLLAKDIFSQYENADRHYHDIRHIQHCLWELDSLKDNETDKPAIELAIWYHDVIYNQRSKNNEGKSAEKLISDLKDFEGDISLNKVGDMIRMSTHRNQSLVEDKTAQYFLDIDLAILGQNATEYRVYSMAVRREYLSVPAICYYYHRKKILKNFLEGDIYRTEWFKKKYETSAQKNIGKELEESRYKFIPILF